MSALGFFTRWTKGWLMEREEKGVEQRRKGLWSKALQYRLSNTIEAVLWCGQVKIPVELAQLSLLYWWYFWWEEAEFCFWSNCKLTVLMQSCDAKPTGLSLIVHVNTAPKYNVQEPQELLKIKKWTSFKCLNQSAQLIIYLLKTKVKVSENQDLQSNI